jgi:cysteine synthase A
VPEIIARHRDEIDALLPVDSDASIDEMRRLAREHGLFVGPSSGANVVASRQWRDAHPNAKTVVSFLCDEGEKYVTDYFS